MLCDLESEVNRGWNSTENGSAGLWLTLLDFLRFYTARVVTAADADDFIYVFFA